MCSLRRLRLTCVGDGRVTFTPYPWQLADVERLRANNFTALLNVEPGGTKTAISCLAVRESGARVVLVCAPKNTFATAWVPTVRAILGVEARVIGNGLKRERVALADFELGVPGVYLVTPQLLARSDVSNWSGDFLVVDECHKTATPRSKAQRKLGGFTAADGEPLGQRFRHRLALSGTPIRQNFENMWSLMRFLWPDLDNAGQIADHSYYRWLGDRMVFDEVVTGFEWVPVRPDAPAPEGARRKTVDGQEFWGRVAKAKKWLAEAEPGRMVGEMPCVITHYRRERCCDWHPDGFLDLDEPQVVHRTVELHSKQRKAIRELEKHYMTWLGENPLVTELTITQQQRIRQICLGVPTVTFKDSGEAEVTFDPDCVSPFIDELLEILGSISDEPVVVFLDSQRFASVVTERLNRAGVPAAEYSGATVKTREGFLREFGSQYRVLVGVTSAIGEGTDGLQHVSSTEVWLETPVSLTYQTQGQSRLDRVGQRKQVQRFVLLDSEGYAEGRVSSLLEKQLKINASLRRGAGEW